MKDFFGCTFMSREELKDIGVKYPIKLEYYRTKTNEEKVKNTNDIKYGIEIIKTSYVEDNIAVETSYIPDILRDEIRINKILEKLKQNKVTPVSAEYIIEDLLKEGC